MTSERDKAFEAYYALFGAESEEDHKILMTVLQPLYDEGLLTYEIDSAQRNKVADMLNNIAQVLRGE